MILPVNRLVRIPFRSVLLRGDCHFTIGNPLAFRGVHIPKRIVVADVYAYLEEQQVADILEVMQELQDDELRAMRAAFPPTQPLGPRLPNNDDDDASGSASWAEEEEKEEKEEEDSDSVSDDDAEQRRQAEAEAQRRMEEQQRLENLQRQLEEQERERQAALERERQAQAEAKEAERQRQEALDELRRKEQEEEEARQRAAAEAAERELEGEDQEMEDASSPQQNNATNDDGDDANDDDRGQGTKRPWPHQGPRKNAQGKKRRNRTGSGGGGTTGHATSTPSTSSTAATTNTATTNATAAGGSQDGQQRHQEQQQQQSDGGDSGGGNNAANQEQERPPPPPPKLYVYASVKGRMPESLAFSKTFTPQTAISKIWLELQDAAFAHVRDSQGCFDKLQFFVDAAPFHYHLLPKAHASTNDIVTFIRNYMVDSGEDTSYDDARYNNNASYLPVTLTNLGVNAFAILKDSREWFFRIFLRKGTRLVLSGGCFTMLVNMTFPLASTGRPGQSVVLTNEAADGPEWQVIETVRPLLRDNITTECKIAAYVEAKPIYDIARVAPSQEQLAAMAQSTDAVRTWLNNSVFARMKIHTGLGVGIDPALHIPRYYDFRQLGEIKPVDASTELGQRGIFPAQYSILPLEVPAGAIVNHEEWTAPDANLETLRNMDARGESAAAIKVAMRQMIHANTDDLLTMPSTPTRQPSPPAPGLPPAAPAPAAPAPAGAAPAVPGPGPVPGPTPTTTTTPGIPQVDGLAANNSVNNSETETDDGNEGLPKGQQLHQGGQQGGRQERQQRSRGQRRQKRQAFDGPSGPSHPSGPGGSGGSDGPSAGSPSATTTMGGGGSGMGFPSYPPIPPFPSQQQRYEQETIITAQEELFVHLKRGDLVRRIGPLYVTFPDPRPSELPLGNVTTVLHPGQDGCWHQKSDLETELPASIIDEPNWSFMVYRQTSLATGQTRKDFSELNLAARLFLTGALYCQY